MSEFDKLEHEGEDYAKQHPEQVKEGEGAVEKKLGLDQQGGGQQGGGQQDNDQQNKAQQNSNQQDNAQQGSSGDGQN
jgi:hypothetical protein